MLHKIYYFYGRVLRMRSVTARGKNLFSSLRQWRWTLISFARWQQGDQTIPYHTIAYQRYCFISVILITYFKINQVSCLMWGGCSSVGRVGQLVIGRLLVRILAEVELS